MISIRDNSQNKSHSYWEMKKFSLFLFLVTNAFRPKILSTTCVYVISKIKARSEASRQIKNSWFAANLSEIRINN